MAFVGLHLGRSDQHSCAADATFLLCMRRLNRSSRGFLDSLTWVSFFPDTPRKFCSPPAPPSLPAVSEIG